MIQNDLGISPHIVSGLIGSIYDCALDPSLWERTLAEFMEAMSGESIILSLNDLRNDRLVIDKSVGWGQFGLEERQKHIPEIHARLNEWFAKGPSLDDPFIASRQLSAEYLERAPYVQHCLKPLGIVDIMHLFLMYTPAHFSEIVVARHQQHGIITDREIELGMLMLPHLRRAVTISNILDAQAVERARMAEVLDALPCAVVLADGDSKILHANRSAESMLRNGDALRDTDGALGARAPQATQELRSAIRIAARDETRLGQVGLSIRLNSSQTPPLFAHVLPLNGSEMRTRLEPEAMAAVFIGSSMAAAFDVTPAEAKEYLSRRFGLTRAEADVAMEILKGDGRAAAGLRLGITAATVRAHLSHIFEKTGVRRQGELIRLLMECGREPEGVL
ncbi:PAS domain-containing protein [Rhizobium sp. NPDC090279]|uniref:PAS domain-containing protein n=1 Tax=Rhizobium sp. NPDC090279 TaxID=3364499 RepID=UPI00383B04FB